MKILVTGGAGYIGSVLTRKLLDSGHMVRIFDNLTFGDGSIKGLDIEVVRGNLTNPEDIERAMEGIEGVIHLAAIVGDPSGKLLPEETVAVNYRGTKQLAETAASSGVKKFILASTCSVYGFREGICLETTAPNPVSLYAESKVSAENAVLPVAGVSPVVLRLGTVFGLSPRMRFDLVANLLIAKALWDGKITVYGRGRQFRPFIHVQDVAEAFRMALETEMRGIYNVGSDELNYSVKRLAEKIRESVPEAEIVFVAEKEDDRSYRADFEKIRRLGFRARHDIAYAVEEIRKMKESGKIKHYSRNGYSNFKTLKKRVDNKEFNPG